MLQIYNVEKRADMTKSCLIYGTPVLELPFGYDEEDELCVALKLKTAEIVSQLSLNGITRYITDCEYGIPMWGAEIVLARKIFMPDISLQVYMPHEEQAVKWSPDWRKRYFTIHRKADKVVICNDRDKCMRELFKRADILVYVGNDTAAVAEIFRNAKKSVHIISY